MSSILITGFAPFGGDEFNPSYEAVKLLPDMIEDVQIIKAELPVTFNGAWEELEKLIKVNNPDAVISIGLAGGRKGITPELFAYNLRYSTSPDNAGYAPDWEKIVEDGPDMLKTALRVDYIASKLNEAGIPSEVSHSAGSFVCNEVMYRLLLAENTQYQGLPTGFIHVPYADEYPHPEDAFAMPIAEIARGLEICLHEIIE